MSKNLAFLASIATFSFIAGCSNTVKDNTLRAVQLTPSIQSVPMVAELEVTGQKVMGQAKGKTQSENQLKKEAIAEALRQVNGDVLVGANFFYEVVDKSDLTVTVIGYPAHYKNFKPKDVCEVKEDILIGGNFSYEDGSNNNISVTIKNPKPAAATPAAPTAPVAAPAVPAVPAAPVTAPAAPAVPVTPVASPAVPTANSPAPAKK